MGAQESAFLLFTKKRITSAFGTLQLTFSLYKNYNKYFLACLLHFNGWKMHQEAFFLRNLINFYSPFQKPKRLRSTNPNYMVIPLLLS